MLNVFNKTHMPVASVRCKRAAEAIGILCDDGTLLKLSTTVRSIKRYGKQFKGELLIVQLEL
ncbi:MAG: hypothetical protein ACKESB_02655 [Candidatus Hodgkinia cicadicola]